MRRTRVVLDVDTGVDDALALLLAARHPALDLRAVTCVAGNVDVDQVVRNSLTVLEAAGRDDVPVARGAARPPGRSGPPRRPVHGTDGLGDLGVPRSERAADPRDAVRLLRDVLGDEEPVTLLAAGPLTNLALLLDAHPAAAGALARVVVVGGSAADVNTAFDPDAAVLALDALTAAGVPVTLYGDDVVHDVRVRAGPGPADGSPAARLALGLLAFQRTRFGPEGAPIGDAGALCAVLDPAGLTTRAASGTVEVALAVDGPRYARLWARTVLG